MSISPGSLLMPPSTPPAESGRRRRLRVSVGDLPLLMAYVYVVAMVVVILIVQPDLIDGPGALTANFSLIVPLALVCFGQTLVMLTRGIDLSVGGVISVSSALLATHLNAKGWLILPEVLAIVALGTLIGVLNGVIIAHTSIQPFIVTLAMWSIWDGVAFGVLPVEGGTVSPDTRERHLWRHHRYPEARLDRCRVTCALAVVTSNALLGRSHRDRKR